MAKDWRSGIPPMADWQKASVRDQEAVRTAARPGDPQDVEALRDELRQLNAKLRHQNELAAPRPKGPAGSEPDRTAREALKVRRAEIVQALDAHDAEREGGNKREDGRPM